MEPEPDATQANAHRRTRFPETPSPPDDARRPVRPERAVGELAALVRASGADDLADRLDRADAVKLLTLTLDERAIMLSSLEDPPKALAELRAVRLADHQWRRGEGLD